MKEGISTECFGEMKCIEMLHQLVPEVLNGSATEEFCRSDQQNL